ncbi:MAG: PQQ-dependent sugar dehydrogenase, partial [Chloroflexota bacterium]
MAVAVRATIAGILLLSGGLFHALPATSQEVPDDPDFWLELEPVADGFELPTFIADPGDGSGRLFILEKPGIIHILENGERLEEPFLDISDRTYSAGFEEGLFAIAFDPDFGENGTFYITSSPEEGKEWRLERFRVSDDDPNRADRGSAETILSVDHLGHTHYGGMMQFGPDGNLWVSLGDGGGAYDPYSNGQNPNTLLGTLMRIDPSQPAGDRAYSIPDDNPFVGVDDHRPEVFAYGLRNPWRFSFDWETGDLYIADVGQNVWEEVNYIPAGPDGIPEGGQNFGWPQMEGMQCSDRAEECDPEIYDHPVAQYNHFYGCSVTGGHVYRGDPDSPIYGHYLYGDFCEGTIWSMTEGESEWDAQVRIDTDLNISSFGEDAGGNLYVADHYGGTIYRIEATTDAPSPVVTRTDPERLYAGTRGCLVDVRGWNFRTDAEVALDGEGQATTFVDPSHLQISLSDEQLGSPGDHTLTVLQGPESDPVTVEIESGIQDRAVQERWSRADGPVATG